MNLREETFYDERVSMFNNYKLGSSTNRKVLEEMAFLDKLSRAAFLTEPPA